MIEKTDDSGYRALWAAVLYQAIRDADRGDGRGTAMDWIYAPRSGAGSMRWICDMLDLDYRKLQHLCMTRNGRSKVLKRYKEYR